MANWWMPSRVRPSSTRRAPAGSRFPRCASWRALARWGPAACAWWSVRRRPAVSRLHHSGAGRHVGDHHLPAAVALSPHDRRVAAGGAQSRLRGLRGQRALRAAGDGVLHGRHQRALRLQLSAPGGRCLASPFRARPQPLHPVHPLRSHLRRNRRSARVGDGGPRHPRPHRFRSESEVGQRDHLHQLRQMRAGVPDRRFGREGQGGGRDGAVRRRLSPHLARRRGADV